jgi:hypothetical protein
MRAVLRMDRMSEIVVVPPTKFVNIPKKNDLHFDHILSIYRNR